MKKSTVILLVLCLAHISFQAFAQGRFSIHAGTSLPMSDFASDDITDEDAGMAALGLNIGVEYNYLLSDKGLGLFGGVDFHYNNLQQDVMNKIKTSYEDLGLNVSEIIYPKYFNIPFSGGLSYTYQANDKIGLFAKGGLTINFFKMTDMFLKANGQTLVTLIDTAYGVGFRVGCGILIDKYTSVSFNYYGLGKLDLDGRVMVGSDSEDIDGKQKVDLATLTIGFLF